MTMVFDVKVYDNAVNMKYTITQHFDKFISVEQISTFLSDWRRQKIANGTLSENSFILSWLAKHEDNADIA